MAPQSPAASQVGLPRWQVLCAGCPRRPGFGGISALNLNLSLGSQRVSQTAGNEAQRPGPRQGEPGQSEALVTSGQQEAS